MSAKRTEPVDSIGTGGAAVRGVARGVRRRGFSMLELVVTISIFAILGGTIVPVVGQKLMTTRDARRLSDLKTIVNAIDGYLADKGSLPDHETETGYGNWDTTLNGVFIPLLLSNNYLRDVPKDPTNNASFHYRYYHYAANTNGFTTDYYVLGIVGFETAAYQANKGYWKSASYDWSPSFAYVTGGVSR
jgi:prepilin-type N-terminal cleavage/methylation domain-containing protein